MYTITPSPPHSPKLNRWPFTRLGERNYTYAFIRSFIFFRYYFVGPLEFLGPRVNHVRLIILRKYNFPIVFTVPARSFCIIPFNPRVGGAADRPKINIPKKPTVYVCDSIGCDKNALKIASILMTRKKKIMIVNIWRLSQERLLF